MSDISPVQTISLWKEGFRSFCRHWQQWLPLGFAFFLVGVASNGVFFHYFEPIQDRIQLYKAHRDPTAAIAFLKDTLPIFSAILFSVSFILYVQHYLFQAFFMAKEMPAQTSGISFNQFFCYVFKGIQLTFLLAVPTLLIGGIIMVTCSVAQIAFMPTFTLMMGLCSALLVYLLVRCYFVMPLTAAKVDAPIKTSLTLTKDVCWRLTLNFLMILLIMTVGYVLASIAAAFLLLILSFANSDALLRLSDTINVVIRNILSSGFQVIFAGVLSAFSSSNCRILYEEKRTANPGFILNRHF
jgi:hypothetical protein